MCSRYNCMNVLLSIWNYALNCLSVHACRVFIGPVPLIYIIGKRNRRFIIITLKPWNSEFGKGSVFDISHFNDDLTRAARFSFTFRLKKLRPVLWTCVTSSFKSNPIRTKWRDEILDTIVKVILYTSIVLACLQNVVASFCGEYQEPNDGMESTSAACFRVGKV